MSTLNQVFADGLAEVGFGGGALRLDFFSLGLPAGEGQNPGREHAVRLVMTPQGFVEAFAVMQGMIQKMRDMGMIQEAPQGGKPAEAPASSPNF